MLKASKGVTASVGEDMLTVRVEGDNPRLWRGAVDKAAALAVTEVSVEGRGLQHRLVITRAGHPPEEIATFADREAAQAAFMTVSDAMMKGDARRKPVASVAKRPLLLRFLAGIGKFVLWVLFLIMIGLIALWLWVVRNPDAAGEASRNAVQQRQQQAPAGPPQGTPLPAEQVFE